MSLLRQPLFRLLAVNLLIGVGAAVLMLAGLLALFPKLRGLIAGDASGAVAVGLLLFGLIVTFGSVAMGAAIMGLGNKPPEDGGRRGALQAAPVMHGRRA